MLAVSYTPLTQGESGRLSRKSIENPVINTPFKEPNRYFRFTDDGITDEIVDGRRPSSYFLPIAQPRKREKQTKFQTEWTVDRIRENEFINQVRSRVDLWRKSGYPGVTTTTRQILGYWNDPTREKKLFFCQIEALETIIYITEVAERTGDVWILNKLKEANDELNASLPRIAMKMATGSGKTVVMGMLIAWHALNKLANPQDARFSDAFLIVAPGITIKDRLRVLLPTDPETYYRQRDIVPSEWLEKLCQAKIVITNFHTLQLREKIEASKLTKEILGNPSAFTETPDEMVRRVCRELGNKKNVVVMNDEAHHCYFRKNGDDEKLKGDDKSEAERRDEDARVWINGLVAMNNKLGVRAVYDLSATPFFLKGSGHEEGTLFHWTVSDFSLIDAIEAGIVKIPRVPVSDNSMAHDLPTYRNLWPLIRDQLPKKGRKDAEGIDGEPRLPKELQGALHSLYSNYEKFYRLWEAEEKKHSTRTTPPVLIVVCNNTSVSKLVFDYISGWEKKVGDSTVVQTGALDIFRNDDGHGNWLPKPNTILVDSEQLESGGAMSDQFRKMASREIEDFKNEYRARYPGRDIEQLTSEDILREVMNTVGKPGKLGEHIRCVVSVSMLTEGWDAQTVTHVLGVRAFGTQLLCEQVVGRALRRMSYATDENEHFIPEYAEVYGVPFSFIPGTGGPPRPPRPPQDVHRVKAMPDRSSAEIHFPKLLGYRYELGEERLTAKFTDASKMVLSTQALPTMTEMDPIVGIKDIHTLDDLKRKRLNEVAFLLAKKVLISKFRDDDGNDRPWLFPQLLDITKQWLDKCVVYKSDTFPQMLLLAQFAQTAVDRIYDSIVRDKVDKKTIKAVFRPYDSRGSTKDVDFDTVRPVYETRADKCHVSHVVADTNSWEQKMAQTLEDMPEVIKYVKNHKLGFFIPYTIDGQEHQYIPDFIAVLDYGQEEFLYLVIEVTGENKENKAVKVRTAKDLWVHAVNNHGGFGRWDFIEIRDPWNAKNLLNDYIQKIGKG